MSAELESGKTTTATTDQFAKFITELASNADVRILYTNKIFIAILIMPNSNRCDMETIIFMNNDAEISRIIILIWGSFNILLGFIMKKYQLAEIIAGYDERKYDKKKSADIAGSNFMLMGLLMIFITIIYFFVPALNLYAYITSIIIIYLGLIIKIVWDTSKHAKIR